MNKISNVKGDHVFDMDNVELCKNCKTMKHVNENGLCGICRKKEKHNLLCFNLQELIYENFGYCNSACHKTIKILDILENEMIQQNILFIPYKERGTK